MLQIKNNEVPDIGQHIFKQIDHNVKWSLIPSTTLHETLHDHYSAGIDPVLPILKKSGDMVKVLRLALLKNDKMVGRVSDRQSYFIKTIRQSIKSGEFEIPISGKILGVDGKNLTHKHLAVTLDTVFANSKIKLVSKRNFEFNLNLKINARL